MQEGEQLNERTTREYVRASYQEPNAMDMEDSIEIEQAVKAGMQASILSISIGGTRGNCAAVTWEMVVKEATMDQEMKQLADLIRNGITDHKDLWPDSVIFYYKVRGELSEKDGVI